MAAGACSARNAAPKVGYAIRLESALSSSTRLCYVTTGMLLRWLASDPSLSGITHVVLDEVHERDLETDFLLILLRDTIRSGARPDLRMVVMSATIQIDLFTAYFGAPVVAVAGSTHPVTEFYLEEALLHTDRVGRRGSAGPGRKSAAAPPAGSLTSPHIAAVAPAAPNMHELSASLRAMHAPAELTGLVCALCEWDSFENEAEFADHAATCMGNGAADARAALRNACRPTRLIPADDAAARGASATEPRLIDGDDEGDAEAATMAAAAYTKDRMDDEIDLTLIADVMDAVVALGRVADGGSILVFLPGWDDITALRDELMLRPLWGDPTRALLLPLHSGVPTGEQRKVCVAATTLVRSEM